MSRPLAIYPRSQKAYESWQVHICDVCYYVSQTHPQAATKLRTFFLSMLEPMRTSMTTNLQMIQSSVWMKYRPLFVFLQRHASNVANEVQRAYVSIVRTFYETGFRRYLRGLGWVKVSCSTIHFSQLSNEYRRLERWRNPRVSQVVWNHPRKGSNMTRIG